MFDFFFCYGTLKMGFCNNKLLQGNGYFVSKAITHSFYRLYECGNFPALIKDKVGVAIEGELWNVKKRCFKTLDEFEGVNISLYRREVILLAEPRVLAHTYLFCQAINNLSECGSVWTKGMIWKP